MARVNPDLYDDSSAKCAFNYFGLNDVDTIAVREAATRIKLRMRRTVEDIIGIGLDLIDIKERVGHGHFMKWIKAEFKMSERSAQNFMGVAEVYADKYASLADLKVTAEALYLLAAPKTPSEVRDEIDRRIDAGELVTKATYDQAMAAHRAAMRQADDDAIATMEREAEIEPMQEVDAPELRHPGPDPEPSTDSIHGAVREINDPAEVHDQEPSTDEIDSIASLVVAMKALRDLEHSTCEAFWKQQRAQGKADSIHRVFKNVTPRIMMLSELYYCDQ
ncbi:hypothetical protein X753_24085 [Mesorhizobium sp. LNJC399B00]|uniref:DUF3102 domain-containing protein n=1 Tax=unclassified Mesorhizobium TaxID=325217 RepID=UPI0003CF3B7F|nr:MULTISPECIES: DUF3102 domain-containing protein [unclassified Mesorhizobium]ESY03242.1 hypothetical protein X753_24085 [Mesorhizobium sp. LNJC399B00]WJI69377.1 DUF3102 domain-containing protein [Mesorhizobium sp. C399B]